MREPFRSQFYELLRRGAGVQDVHDIATATGFAVTHTDNPEDWLDREVERVETHRSHLLPLLEHFVGPAPSVLDLGCSTGGTTVALALSKVLEAADVVGVDPNRQSIEAARIRARGYDLENVQFAEIEAGKPLPFSDGRFHLTVCVSVIEYVSTQEGRNALALELERVTRPGGFIFVATPNPLRLRDYHTGRFLGEFRRREGYPWSPRPWELRRMFPACRRIPLDAYRVAELLGRRGWPGARLLAPVSGLIGRLFPWQKLLFRKNGSMS